MEPRGFRPRRSNGEFPPASAGSALGRRRAGSILRVVADLALGREVYERRAWRDAYGFLVNAALVPGLAAEDLERLAIAANLIGAEDWVDRWADADRVRFEGGLLTRAARCAGWLAYGLLSSG